MIDGNSEPGSYFSLNGRQLNLHQAGEVGNKKGNKPTLLSDLCVSY